MVIGLHRNVGLGFKDQGSVLFWPTLTGLRGAINTDMIKRYL